MKRALIFIALAALVVGCHAKFKKFARTADTVDVQVMVTGSPIVDLVERGGSARTPVGDLANLAVGTAAQIESVKVEKRLESVMEPDSIKKTVESDAIDHIGNGPPFGTGTKSLDGTVQVEVTRYGIVQSGGGPTFVVDYRVRVYSAADNKRVYHNEVSCWDREFFTYNTPGNIAGTVATINHLNKMSDEEIKKNLDATIRRCTGFLVAEMRDDAG